MYCCMTRRCKNATETLNLETREFHNFVAFNTFFLTRYFSKPYVSTSVIVYNRAGKRL